MADPSASSAPSPAGGSPPAGGHRPKLRRRLSTPGDMVSWEARWAGEASSVSVSGSWNSWGKRVKLAKEGDGTFVARVVMLRQFVSYKYIVDGVWRNDESKPMAADEFGNINNVVDLRLHAEESSELFSSPSLPDLEGAAGKVEEDAARAAAAPEEDDLSISPVVASAVAVRLDDEEYSLSPAPHRSAKSGEAALPRPSSTGSLDTLLTTRGARGFGAGFVPPRDRSTDVFHYGERSVRRLGRLVIVMVGLPHMGKTFVARKLAHHLRWMGHSTEIFNVGATRRALFGKRLSDFFDPEDAASTALRQQAAKQTIEAMLKQMEEDDLDIAVYDATNINRAVRVCVCVCSEGSEC
eukprot:PLAT9104.1.p1 GENE.PLAT9104.1~~PLAT9104.1.p1  ORF type:complete len:353 (-),score=105.25 PLAT9104.1:21-1079(-)